MVKYPLNQESIFNIKTFWTGVIKSILFAQSSILDKSAIVR